MAVGYQLLGVLLGVASLQGIYRLIESSWPASYFTLADYTSYRKTVKPLSYGLFRLLPVFMVALFLSVSLERGDLPVWPAVLVTLLCHVSLTHGKAMAAVWPRRNDPRRSPLVALHVLVSLVIVAVGVTAVLVRGPMAPLIPPLDSLAAELWGALAAGAFGAFLVNRVQGSPVDEAALVRRTRERIGSELINLARSEAVEHGADPDLVEAILITEDIQRPAWFRRLERFKSFVFREGTYGVMQVRGRRWISDEESIRIATSTLLAGRKVPSNRHGYIDAEALRKELDGYNRSENWNAMVVDILLMVRNWNSTS